MLYINSCIYTYTEELALLNQLALSADTLLFSSAHFLDDELNISFLMTAELQYIIRNETG